MEKTDAVGYADRKAGSSSALVEERYHFDQNIIDRAQQQ